MLELSRESPPIHANILLSEQIPETGDGILGVFYELMLCLVSNVLEIVCWPRRSGMR